MAASRSHGTSLEGIWSAEYSAQMPSCNTKVQYLLLHGKRDNARGKIAAGGRLPHIYWVFVGGCKQTEMD